MKPSKRSRNFLLLISRRLATTVLAIAVTLAIAATQAARAQTFTVIHNFTDGQDGATPTARLTTDKAGNLYGTASKGGGGFGTVYKLTRKNGSWVFTPLYSFQGGVDGAAPAALGFGPDGALYGTTTSAGVEGCGGNGCGTVFSIKPGVSACTTALCPWAETVLYSFTGGADGGGPKFANALVFDQAGNIFGTAGVVYELSPSGGHWTESVLYNFPLSQGSGYAPYAPYAGVIFDKAGNLYGTTAGGDDLEGDCIPSECGAVYELTPSGSGWIEATLWTGFPLDSLMYAGLISDQSGNLYGAIAEGGASGGNVFEVTPDHGYQQLYGFPGPSRCGPWDSLVMDATGNLYGAAFCDGVNFRGVIFKLTLSKGSWRYSSLHDFAGGADDGSYPIGGVVLDANGNLYGTTSAGGLYSQGVVWEITP